MLIHIIYKLNFDRKSTALLKVEGIESIKRPLLEIRIF